MVIFNGLFKQHNFTKEKKIYKMNKFLIKKDHEIQLKTFRILELKKNKSFVKLQNKILDKREPNLKSYFLC